MIFVLFSQICRNIFTGVLEGSYITVSEPEQVKISASNRIQALITLILSILLILWDSISLLFCAIDDTNSETVVELHNLSPCDITLL
jgi:hypothetical protein